MTYTDKQLAAAIAMLDNFSVLAEFVRDNEKKNRRWRRVDEYEPGLRRAVTAIGSITKLAKALNISPQAIVQWDTIPVARVVDVERVTGVARERLRPDIFRKEQP
jgi:Putative antitoxin of bacterial toxin-antitoxin system, YdaS/YdaT